MDGVSRQACEVVIFIGKWTYIPRFEDFYLCQRADLAPDQLIQGPLPLQLAVDSLLLRISSRSP
jgi:hypothetical protein